MHWIRDHHIKKQLPIALQMWTAYMNIAPHRASGGVVGGSIAHKLAMMLIQLRSTIGAGSVHCVLRQENVIPKQFVVDTSDFEVVNHTIDLWRENSSEKALLESVAAEGLNFFDVGANHGVFALVAGAMSPTNQAWAFEPQPRAAEAIRRSIKKNSLANVTVVEAVVSDRCGEFTFFSPKSGSGVGSLAKEQGAQSGSAVELSCAGTTLDAFVTEMGVDRLDLMKVDVEGFEYAVFNGGRETLKNLQPIIWFEMNPPAILRAGHEQENVFSLLRDTGYSTFLDVGTLHLNSPTPVNGPVVALTNIVAFPASKVSHVETIRRRIMNRRTRICPST